MKIDAKKKKSEKKKQKKKQKKKKIFAISKKFIQKNSKAEFLQRRREKTEKN